MVENHIITIANNKTDTKTTDQSTIVEGSQFFPYGHTRFREVIFLVREIERCMQILLNLVIKLILSQFISRSAFTRI